MRKLMMAVMAAAALSSAPALAADKLACDDAGMQKVEMMMKDKMAMADKKDMAMKESEMAMKAKEAGKMDDCAMHLNMAHDALMTK